MERAWATRQLTDWPISVIAWLSAVLNYWSYRGAAIAAMASGDTPKMFLDLSTTTVGRAGWKYRRFSGGCQKLLTSSWLSPPYLH